MRLTDLNPWWVGSGGEGVTMHGQPVPRREAVAISFDCPCGCGSPLAVYIANPIDGGPTALNDSAHCWQRTGETFENLSLTPSLQRVGGCGWHGFVTNGEIVNC